MILLKHLTILLGVTQQEILHITSQFSNFNCQTHDLFSNLILITINQSTIAFFDHKSKIKITKPKQPPWHFFILRSSSSHFAVDLFIIIINMKVVRVAKMLCKCAPKAMTLIQNGNNEKFMSQISPNRCRRVQGACFEIKSSLRMLSYYEVSKLLCKLIDLKKSYRISLLANW